MWRRLDGWVGWALWVFVGGGGRDFSCVYHRFEPCFMFVKQADARTRRSNFTSVCYKMKSSCDGGTIVEKKC